MRVILDIDPDDAFYIDKDKLIGKEIKTFVQDGPNKLDGIVAGSLTLKYGVVTATSQGKKIKRLFFYKVKISSEESK